MARREYKSMEQGGGNLPDVPFAENLVFYAPLTEGDLTDHITGNTLNYTQGLQWDSAMGMYKFDKVDKAYEMYYDVNLVDIVGDYTLVCEYKPSSISRYNYPVVLILGSYAESDEWRPGIASNSSDTSGERAEQRLRISTYSIETKTALVYMINGQGDVEFLCDYGNQTNTICIPDNWNSSNKCRTRLSVCPKRDHNDTMAVWIKDIRIYNRFFTPEEIAQL
mgnify:FL=1